MTPNEIRPPCVLSIAGSDSGGGAGVQADLKAFARCGVHGMTAITALTAQNTVGVTAVDTVSPQTIVAQVEAVAEDIGVDAVKIGMLGSGEAVEAVAKALDRVGEAPVVLDPVMVAESGAPLSDEPTRTALVEVLLPRATVVTPNIEEARLLATAATAAGDRPEPTPDSDAPHEPATQSAGDATVEDLARLARTVHSLGPAYVVVTGGHAAEATDVIYDGARVEPIAGVRRRGGATHGSGCTHSSTLAAQLALGMSALEAAKQAKRVAEEAVEHGLVAVGAGAGPVSALGALIPFHLAPGVPRAESALT